MRLPGSGARERWTVPQRLGLSTELSWLLAGVLVYWLALFLFAWRLLSLAWLFALLGFGTALILAGQFFHRRQRP